MFDTLAQIRNDVAQRLAEGAANRRSAMHTPVVVAGGADARVMVLRAFDRVGWRLRFHTDARSPKVGVIADGAPVGVLFYDREAKVQIRCKGRGRIETDTRAVDAAWAKSTNFARRCYLGEGPGALSDGPTSGLPDWVQGVQPTEEQLVKARRHFAILLVDLETADWLSLAHTGHRRAQIDLASGEGRWVTP